MRRGIGGRLLFRTYSYGLLASLVSRLFWVEEFDTIINLVILGLIHLSATLVRHSSPLAKYIHINILFTSLKMNFN